MLVNFQELFESSPGLYLVLDPGLRIVAVTDNYLRATMTVRAEVLGRHLFDVFPDNPDDPDATGVANLRASLERVLLHRTPDTMAVQKYDVERPAEAGGGFEVRYWSPRNNPVLDADGEVRLIIHQAEDVTALILLQQQDDWAQAEILRRADESHQASRFLAALLDNLDVAVGAVNDNGDWTVFNRALRELYDIPESWAPPRVNERLVDATFAPDGTPMGLEATPLVRAMHGEHVRGADLIVRVPGRRERTFVAHAQPITSSDGRRLGAVAALHDVTAVRRAERFRDCEQQVMRILATADSIEDATPRMLRVVAGTLGWPHAELWLADPLTDTLRSVGQWSAPGLSRSDQPGDPIRRGAGIVGTVWATGESLLSPDVTAEEARQGIRTVLAVPVRDGDVIFGVLTCYASTPEGDKDLLSVLLAGIATHIGLSVTMRRAADLNGQLNRSRDDFLTLVGHELRTPLTTISGFASMLAEEPDAPPGDVRHMVQAIDRKARSLRTLVDSLLELAGLESGHVSLDVTDLDLAELVTEAVAAAQPAAGTILLHSDLPDRLPIHGDAARLRQLVDELLANAIKYSPSGGDVHVRLRAVAGVAELSVRDRGIGIPPADRHRLFDRFYRAGNVAHQGFPGIGLGLSMVRIIAEMHRGTITFDPTHNPGTSVLIRLPR